MNNTEFVSDALRTESKPEKLNFSKSGLNLLLRTSIQMAKLMDTAKKTMFYGKPLDASKFREQVDALREDLQRLGQRQNLATPDDTISVFHDPNLRLLHGAVGCFGESGELLEAVHKQLLSGEIDMVNVGEENGDLMWYQAVIADETGVSFDQTQETVINKLKARYGDKFTNEAALNRDLSAERAVLEEGLQTS